MELTLPPALPQIRLEQVSSAAPVGLYYLLQDVSFEVFRGDRIALLGASGSGKTSLLRLLNRLDEPSQGTIYLDGQALRQIPARRLRQQVMLVLQEPKLLGMTVQAALAYPLVLQEVPQRTIEQRVQDWLGRLSIPQDWLERSELQLSLGERQRVAIARALLAEPKILLLDEPTSALDVGGAEKILQALSLNNDLTVIMATHQLDLARRFCNRVLLLRQGKLVEDVAGNSLDWQQLRETFRLQEQLSASEWN